MDIQWIIASCGDRLQEVENVLLAPQYKLSYVVSVQSLNKPFPEIPEALKRKDVTLDMLDGVGLSANRNHGLKLANADILVVGDDDIRLKPDYPKRVLKIFKEHPEVDVACFQILTSDTGSAYKTYPKRVKSLTSLNALKQVSSIEIAFRSQKVCKKGIRFDERFGLGTPANHGEEFLFLAQCLRRGLNIRFFPVYAVEHPSVSSVNQRSVFDDSRLFTTGAQNYVLFGPLAYIWHLLAVLRRYKALRQHGISPRHFLAMKQAGCRYIQKGIIAGSGS